MHSFKNQEQKYRVEVAQIDTQIELLKRWQVELKEQENWNYVPESFGAKIFSGGTGSKRLDELRIYVYKEDILFGQWSIYFEPVFFFFFTL